MTVLENCWWIGRDPVKLHRDVFNLILTDDVFFVANNFVARSKPPAESGQHAIADHRHNLTVIK